MTHTSAPHLRRLVVKGFRGLKEFDWTPHVGLNVLLGGGDAGKTTVLEAIALLLRPTGSVQLSDSDYWLRQIDDGFSIEGTFYLPEAVGISQLPRMVYPWEWDGTQACIPDEEEASDRDDPVYVFRVRATPEFEAFHEIVDPSGGTDYFPVSLRRRIGLVWLADDDVDRDLRLVYGSALDRLLSDPAIRARLAREISSDDISGLLKTDGQENLALLEKAFREKALPEELGLGLTGGRRISVASLVGLTAEKVGARLPLSTWGAGTQRLAALEVASANQTGTPVTLVDELERGLEPHRQRQLTAALGDSPSQSVMTTHSPVVLSAAVRASMWYLDPDGSIGLLPDKAVGHAVKDPEAFLARVTVLAEGATEVGFLTALLERALGLELGTVGISVTDAGGNEAALGLLEGLAKAGLRVGAFVDNENRNPGRWRKVRENLGELVFQWEEGCTEENVIREIKSNQLEELVIDPSGNRTGDRLRSLQERLRADDKEWSTLVSAVPDIRETVIHAAMGSVPVWATEADDRKRFKKHSQHWFKSAAGGLELANKAVDFGVWAALRAQLWPLIETVCQTAGLKAKDLTDGNA